MPSARHTLSAFSDWVTSLVAADMMRSLHGCRFIAKSMNRDLQITWFVLAAVISILVLARSKKVIAARNRVVAPLNFLTGKGVDYYPNNCNKKGIGALISNYFESNGNDESDGSDWETMKVQNSSINTYQQ